LLIFSPSLDVMLVHIPQILNDMGMVGNAIDNVNISELIQPLAGEFIALKTPRNVLLIGALTKAVPALLTMREYSFRETSITANFPCGNTGFLGYFA
jgi:hypothetical protein